jgi:hypothetical protein
LIPLLRRPYINLIPPLTDSDDDDDNTHTTFNEAYVETLGIRFCKRCNFALVWRKDLNNVYCQSCGWQPLLKKEKKEKVKAQEDDI